MTRTALLLLLVSCATVPPQKTRVPEFASPLHDSISFSGDALFLTRTTADFARSEMLELRHGKWIAVPFANGAASGASVDGSGTKVFFTRTDTWDLWVAERDEDGGWNAKGASLPKPINSDAWDCCGVADAKGDLYFASNREGSWDIFVARKDGSVERVDALSSGTTGGTPSPSGRNGEWPSYVDPAGRFILFSSIREGGFGGDDIYYAFSDGAGGWQAPRNAGPLVNTTGYEDAPTVRGVDLFWSSRDDKSASDVYRIPLRAIVKE